MGRTLLLDRDAARAALPYDALLDAVRAALVAAARGTDSSPPRIAAFGPVGLLGAMPGYVPGFGLGGKLVSVFPVAGEQGRSDHQGIVALFDETDGRLLALIDAEPVTALRTAASATVALLALAPDPVRRVAVVGAGTQARAQLGFLQHLHLDAEVVVASRDPRSAAGTAERFGVASAASVREAVTGADLVLSCTDADRPVVDRDWLEPPVHVGAVGGSRGPELDHRTVTEAAVFAEWPGAATCPPPAGAHDLQDLPEGHVRLIGELLDGPAQPRPAKVTVFRSTGYAGLDVAAAAVATEVATTEGLGRWVDL